MPIKVKCDSCQKIINAPDKFAGKRVKCPGCQAPLFILDPDLPAEESAVIEYNQMSARPSQKGIGKKIGKVSKGKSKIAPKSKNIKGPISRNKTTTSAPKNKALPKADTEEDTPKGSTKKLILIAALIVVVVLIGAGIWYFFFNGTSSVKSSAAPNTNESKLSVIGLIPSSCSGLVGINLDKALTNPNLKEMLEKSITKERLEKFYAELNDNDVTKQLKADIAKKGALTVLSEKFGNTVIGFEQPKDLSNPNPPEVNFIALNQTKLDATALIVDIVKMLNIKMESKSIGEGLSAYEFENKGNKGMLSALNSDYLATGTPTMINAAAALAKGDKPNASIKSVAKLFKPYNQYKNKLLWMAFYNSKDTPEPTAETVPENTSPQMIQMPIAATDVASSHFFIDYEASNLTLHLELILHEAEKADKLKMSLTAVAPMILGMAGLDPQLLKIEVDGESFQASIELSDEMLKRLSEKSATMTTEKDENAATK